MIQYWVARLFAARAERRRAAAGGPRLAQQASQKGPLGAQPVS